jgi:glycosyltransferase involved in cell wall biosynthesis
VIAASPGPITWTFLAPGCPRPTGGDIARFEIVNSLARRGGDVVRVVHLPTEEMWIRNLADLPWFDFESTVEHRFAADLDPSGIPDADVVVYSTKLLATALAPTARDQGRRLVDALQGGSGRQWLPILFLQGHGVFPAAVEELALRLPGPKVCVGSWLARLVVERGVPASDVVHIPNGVDPRRFWIRRPIEDRSPSVAMNFDPYPAKRGRVGIEAVERLRRQLDVPGTVFGTIPQERELATGVDFVLSPSQDALAERIYNEASMFLQPSRQEGFGMCAVEAMACGCALVTTANGGSADYAFDGETALVCGGDAGQMADALGRLVHDDELRRRLAVNGARYVERFRWSSSADRLAALASERLAQPDPHHATDQIDLEPIVRELPS